MRARFCAVLGLVLACAAVNPYLRGDGNGYYAWLVSPVIDGDVDFTNEFARGDSAFRTWAFEADGQVRERNRTPTGHIINHWSVGPALLWAPWFAVAHVGVVAARGLGSDIPADGFSWPYLTLVSIGTVLYGAAALWLAARLARALGYARGSAWATAGIALASSLPVYQVFLPFHVHALAAFSVSAFVAWWASHSAMDRVRDWTCWGALAGLMVAVYQLHIAFVFVAAWMWGRQVPAWPLVRSLAHGAAFVGAAAVVLLPQIIGKMIVYGHPLKTGYHGGEFVFADLRWWQVLWSANHGWFLWTPIALFGVVGFVLVARRHPSWRPWWLGLVCCYVVVAAYKNWHGQSAFGLRYFVSLSVFLVIGLAALVEWTLSRPAGTRHAMKAVIVLLSAWNVGFMFQWGTNIVPNRGPVSLWHVAVNQVTVVPQSLTRFAGRYFGHRREVQAEVEGSDNTERRSHVNVR